MLTPSLKTFLCLLLLFVSLQTSATETAVIAAASSIKFALQEIATAFQQETGRSVRISYSSSGNLTRQIIQGGPFELFLSANSDYVKKLFQQQKTLDQGRTFALGQVALLTPKNSAISIDTQLNGVRQAIENNQLNHFAIANSMHAPYGVASREILQHLGLWEKMQAYLVLGENVAQATQFTYSGAAQAGLVSYSLVLGPGLQKTTRSILIPNHWHQPLKQTAVLLKNASETAKLFYNFLLQEKARLILARYGYSRP